MNSEAEVGEGKASNYNSDIKFKIKNKQLIMNNQLIVIIIIVIK